MSTWGSMSFYFSMCEIFQNIKQGGKVILLEEDQENDNLHWREISEENPQNTRDFYPIIAVSFFKKKSLLRARI